MVRKYQDRILACVWQFGVDFACDTNFGDNFDYHSLQRLFYLCHRVTQFFLKQIACHCEWCLIFNKKRATAGVTKFYWRLEITSKDFNFLFDQENLLVILEICFITWTLIQKLLLTVWFFLFEASDTYYTVHVEGRKNCTEGKLRSVSLLIYVMPMPLYMFTFR